MSLAHKTDGETRSEGGGAATALSDLSTYSELATIFLPIRSQKVFCDLESHPFWAYIQ